MLPRHELCWQTVRSVFSALFKTAGVRAAPFAAWLWVSRGHSHSFMYVRKKETIVNCVSNNEWIVNTYTSTGILYIIYRLTGRIDVILIYAFSMSVLVRVSKTYKKNLLFFTFTRTFPYIFFQSIISLWHDHKDHWIYERLTKPLFAGTPPSKVYGNLRSMATRSLERL